MGPDVCPNSIYMVSNAELTMGLTQNMLNCNGKIYWCFWFFLNEQMLMSVITSLFLLFKFSVQICYILQIFDQMYEGKFSYSKTSCTELAISWLYIQLNEFWMMLFVFVKNMSNKNKSASDYFQRNINSIEFKPF